MRAVIITKPGAPEVLRIEEHPEPRLNPGQLRVAVHATALNRADLLQRRGFYPPPTGCTEILGLECAGVVTEVATGADRGWLGKRVMALLPGGGYAEQVVIHQRMAIEIPERLDFVEAAAVVEAFMTAQEALFERARLEPDERVLVHAAAGGVGSAAVQLAHAAGATVFATAGTTAKCELATNLGASVAINYKETDFAAQLSQHGMDVIVDCVGSRYYPQHEQLLARGGRLVVLGLLGGRKPAQVDFGRVLSRQLSIVGMVLRSRTEAQKIALTRRFIRHTLPLLSSGTVRPVVDEVFDFEGVVQAHHKMEANENLGKIVLRVRE